MLTLMFNVQNARSRFTFPSKAANCKPQTAKMHAHAHAHEPEPEPEP